MAITVHCDNCRYEYKVGEKFVGQRVKCKNCGNSFTINLPEADPFAEASFRPTAAETPTDEGKKWKLKPIVPDDMAKASAPMPAAADGGRHIVATNRRARMRAAGGPALAGDKLIAYALFAYFAAMVAMGVYGTVRLCTDSANFPNPATSVLVLWVLVVIYSILLFAVHGPMILLGTWSASKILQTAVMDGSYLRACAVAALPTLLAYVAIGMGFPVGLLVLLGVIPVSLWVMRTLFRFDLSGITIALVIGLAGWIVGLMLQALAIGAVGTGMAPAFAIANGMPAFHPSGTDAIASATTNPSTSGHDNPLADFRENVQAKTFADLSLVTQEEKAPDVAETRRQLELLRPRYANDPDWQDTEKAVKDYADKIAARPSGVFDASIFKDDPDLADITTGSLSRAKLSEEVSFHQFKLQPPQAMKLDLRSSESSPNGVAWISMVNPNARLSIYTRSRGNPKQRRPIFTHDPALLHKAQTEQLLAIDDTDLLDPEYGQINGIPFAHVSTKPGAAGEHTEYFIGPADKDWLYIQLDIPPELGSFATLMVISARTVRPVDSGEATVNPFAAARVAPRLMEDPNRVAAILRHDPDAEDVLIPMLPGGDFERRRWILSILKDMATEKSLPALKNAARDPDPIVAAQARGILARLGDAAGVSDTVAAIPATTPDHASPAPDASKPDVLANLSSNDGDTRKDAAVKLAFIPPDDSEKSAISGKLAAMLRAADPAVPVPILVAALSAWAGPNTVTDLLPLLQENSDETLRHAAMTVFANAKLADGATALIRWLIKDPANTSDALIAIGSGAEDPVIEFLSNKSAPARLAAAQILARIGTKKSIAKLTRASMDPRDAAARDAAKSALAEVRAREGMASTQSDPK